MNSTHKYTREEVTIVWKPDICIHSAICVRGLPGVFDPRRRPWIDMDQADDVQHIVEQVKKCPSGALSYYINEPVTPGTHDPVAEERHITEIEVTPNGPVLIKNECVITHSNGQKENKNGIIALCRCGSSNNKPYCDGSHKKIDFKE